MIAWDELLAFAHACDELSHDDEWVASVAATLESERSSNDATTDMIRAALAARGIREHVTEIGIQALLSGAVIGASAVRLRWKRMEQEKERRR